MEHKAWSPERPGSDSEPAGCAVGKSSFDPSRSFDFGPVGPSSDSIVAGGFGWPAQGPDDPTIAVQGGDVEGLVVPTGRPRARPASRPKIPGYEILGELGRGAMGVVYRARQLRLNREVAIKMILAGDHAGPDAIARFVAEAETIARLKHPNIVQIYAIGDCEGRPYVELEYVEGGSLGSRLDGTPWPPRAAARLLGSLARAAGEAHRLGVVHRDIKPANILMTAGGEPKVSDFGLAKTLEADAGLTRTEAILGTPNYMAPEQAEGHAKDVGPPADIYALGANLYELLTGRPPFVAPTILGTLDLVKNADPVPLRRLQPHLDRDLETICLKCLEKEPLRRYGTADDLADDVEAYLAGEPIRGRRPPPWERAWRWARTRPAAVALILVSTLAVVVAAAGVRWRRAEVSRIEAESRQNAAATRRQVDRHVLLGREALGRGEWEAARTQFTSAKALVQSEGRLFAMKGGVGRLLEDCGRKIAEQRSLEAARGRFAAFQSLYDETVFYRSDYTGLDPEANIRAGRDSASRALGEFGLGPRASGAAGGPAGLATEARHFNARELERIGAGCYELTLLLSDSVAHPLPGEDAAAQNLRSLEVLGSAAGLGVPTPAFHLRRAAALERAGDAEGAAAERGRARQVPLPGWSAVDHFLTGEEAYRRKDYRRAIESFHRSLSIQPDRFWAQYFLAVCLLKEHRPAEAQSALIACQSRRPGFAWSYLLKGFAEGEMRAFDLAEEDFRRADELRLNDQERYVLLVNRGVMRIRRGRVEDAVADLAGAVALKPGQFEAYINLATALQDLGRWDEALSTLGRAIGGHPGEAVLYRARSRAYRLRSMTAEALDDLRRAIGLSTAGDPDSAGDRLELALALQQAGRFEESLGWCDGALALTPDRPEPHRARGVALMMLRRYDEAIGSFDACVARGGGSAALHEARGLALASRGSYERALADYTMALGLGRATPSLLANRGWAYLLGGAPAPALRDFDESLRLENSNGHALGGRALTYAQLRRPREAVADARASVLLGPDDSRQAYNAARVYCQAAACLESTSDRDEVMMANASKYRAEALRLLARAVDLCPDADRRRFWDEFVRKDVALDLIRKSRSFIALGARVAGGRPPVAAARQRTGL